MSSHEITDQHILDVAMAIMHSDFASMQVYDPERHALRLLTYRGFIQSAADAWAWIFPHSGTSCALTLASGVRTIVADIETCEAIKHQGFRDCGIRAMQTTPLRVAGRFVGTVSTHWRTVHRPTDSELHLFDVWAQQTADVMVKNEDVAKLLREAVTQIERNKDLTRAFELLMLQRLSPRGTG